MYASAKVAFFWTILFVLLVQVVAKLALYPLINAHLAIIILNIIEILVLPPALASLAITTMAFRLIVSYVGSVVLHAKMPILAIPAKYLALSDWIILIRNAHALMVFMTLV